MTHPTAKRGKELNLHGSPANSKATIIHVLHGCGHTIPMKFGRHASFADVESVVADARSRDCDKCNRHRSK